MAIALRNNVVVITGGAGLLGRTLVRAVVANGGIAVCADRDGEAGRTFTESLSEEYGGDRVGHFPLDITSPSSVEELYDHVFSKWGAMDALVNCAYPRNPHYGRPFEEITYSDFCENVSCHLGGYFLTSQRAAIRFKKQGHGNIVNFASIYGVITPRFEIYEGTRITMPVEYAAIKSAVIHLTKYLAAYYKGCGIRANCISPGGILNGQPDSFVENYNRHALTKGMLAPDDIAGSLLFLLSEDSSFINGQNIVVDDGWTL